jgi:hypothetical protein
MSGEVFDELFIACFKELHDKEYCRSVVETVAELAEKRYVAYRGKMDVAYVLNLPRDDNPHVLIAVDRVNKKGLILTLVSGRYVIFLTYERGGNKFRPVRAEVTNAEIAAAAYYKDC